jgi:predicted GNAT family acetyltransferase
VRQRQEATGVRVLGHPDLPEFLQLTAQHPVVNVFAEHRARQTRLEPRFLGGEVLGRFREGRLVAACHVGANLVPVECTPEDARLLAAELAERRRSVATVLGPDDAVAALWEELAPGWGRPREVRWSQPHLETGVPALVESDPAVVPTPLSALDALYPAAVAMYREEVGTDPEAGAPRGFYRTRVQQLVSKGWSFSRIEDDRVVFKAEVVSATPFAAQVQGVWVAPERRGEGLGTRGMAAVVDLVRRDIAPVVSLYVNAWNEPARRAYGRVGFVQTATFATIMF